MRASERLSGGAQPPRFTMPWGTLYGTGFGAITASRIAHEAHLQGYYIGTLGLAPSLVGAGWSVFCGIVALAEPIIGATLDFIRSKGFRVPMVLLGLLVPWLALVHLIWAPPWQSPPVMFACVVAFGLLQATLNLGLLSVYPTLFPSKEARATALVPQQVMTIAGLLLGMNLPIILSDEWKAPQFFASSFAAALAIPLSLSLFFLSAFFKTTPKPATAPAPASSDPASVKKKGRVQELLSVLDNRVFRLVLCGIFLSQLGNALLASTLPLFAKHVIDLSVPVGPLFGGIVLDSKWQFSVSYFVFYLSGALTGPIWARMTKKVGATRTLRRAYLMYACGCLALPLLPGGLLSAWLPDSFPQLFPSEAAKKLVLFVLCFFWNGCALGGMVSLPDLIIAEEVNRDERRSKGASSRAGSMYGSKQLVYRMASATQGVVTGTVMSVSGYQGGPAVVSMGAKYGFGVLTGVLPSLCYVCAAGVLSSILVRERQRDTEDREKES